MYEHESDCRCFHTQLKEAFGRGVTTCCPSAAGVILRDSHGVAQVRFVTGNKILRILKSKGLAPDLPEDLYHLIKKAVAVRKHLERNRKVKEQSHLGVQNLSVSNWLDGKKKTFVSCRTKTPSSV